MTKRLILLAVLLLGFTSTGGIVQFNAVTAAAGGQTFADDFSGDLSKWANTTNWEISDGTLGTSTPANLLIVYGTATDTASQYAAFKISTWGEPGYGPAVRIPDTAPGAGDWNYTVEPWSDGNAYVILNTGNTYSQDIASCAITAATGNSIGIDVAGTSTGTTINVYYWSAQSPPARASWGSPACVYKMDGTACSYASPATACACLQTDCVPSNYANTGLYVGIADQTAYVTLLDDFAAGDIP